ncbi:sugar nucleotide-binding protein [Streptomyces sp. NPDC057540]|uniref:sugar nucleotide-binding protein n=1 Tax=Streptomyces sp. NPDC057540 TaxID=3346160 RepID=UPI0036B36F87
MHVSSDSVVSGADSLYDETVLPNRCPSYGAANTAAETAVRLLHSAAVVVRTSLTIGDGGSSHKRVVHASAASAGEGALFTDDVRCPVHVADLAAALWELAISDATGVLYLTRPDAISRYELGALIARPDGIAPSLLPASHRVGSPFPGALDVRLDTTATQHRLGTRAFPPRRSRTSRSRWRSGGASYGHRSMNS